MFGAHKPAPTLPPWPFTNFWRLKSDGTDSVGSVTLSTAGSITYGSSSPAPNTTGYATLGSNNYFSTTALGLYQSFTLWFWVNFSSLSPSDEWLFVYGGLNDWNNVLDSDKFLIRPNSINNSIFGSTISCGSPTANTWYRFIITRTPWTGSNGVITGYINGTQVWQNTSIPLFSLTSGSMYLWRLGWTNGQLYYLNGNISDVFLYNGAWTPTQVANDYAFYV